MAQYSPAYKADEYKEINRRLTSVEYGSVAEHFRAIGLVEGYVQQI
jgi:putative pyruvate formate lyase activating enzyme